MHIMMNVVSIVETLASLTITATQFTAEHYSELKYTHGVIRHHASDMQHYLSDLRRFESQGNEWKYNTRMKDTIESIDAVLHFCETYSKKNVLKRFLFSSSYQKELDRLAMTAFQRHLMLFLVLENTRQSREDHYVRQQLSDSALIDVCVNKIQD